MTSGQILHGTHKGVQVLYYRGDVRHTLCIALDRYLQQLLEQPHILGFVVDLTQAYSIDSTNLGILARLARLMQQAQLPKVTLISNQPDITELLEAVGFDNVFNIVEELYPQHAQLTEITPVEAKNGEATVMMLEAHRALMELNAANKVLFRDVVKAFESELEE